MKKKTSATPGEPSPAADGASTQGARKPKRKLGWLALTTAAVVLLGTGTWFGSTLPDPTASDAYVQLSQGKAGADSDFKRLQDNYGVLNRDYSTLRMGIEDREAKASARESAAAAAEKKNGEAAAAVKKREDAVTGAEATKAKNTVSDGTWTVGRNIEPGSYATTSDVGSSCYWAILTSGTNGSDIVDNDIPGGGRPSVTLSAGQDFKTARCGTWTKQ